MTRGARTPACRVESPSRPGGFLVLREIGWPNLSQSAMVKPDSARTSSCGIGWLCWSHSSASVTAARSASLKGVALLFGRNHGFEQMDHGSELARAELIEQAMGV